MRRAAILAATILLAACSGDPASAPVLSVVITAPKQTIAVGEALQLTTVARDVNGVTVSDAKIAYTASPPTVISVTASGVVTGRLAHPHKKLGAVAIIAKTTTMCSIRILRASA